MVLLFSPMVARNKHIFFKNKKGHQRRCSKDREASKRSSQSKAYEFVACLFSGAYCMRHLFCFHRSLWQFAPPTLPLLYRVRFSMHCYFGYIHYNKWLVGWLVGWLDGIFFALVGCLVGWSSEFCLWPFSFVNTDNISFVPQHRETCTACNREHLCCDKMDRVLSGVWTARNGTQNDTTTSWMSTSIYGSRFWFWTEKSKAVLKKEKATTTTRNRLHLFLFLFLFVWLFDWLIG